MHLFWNIIEENWRKIGRNYGKIGFDIYLNKYDEQGTLWLKIE